jgi:hypothetical protein
MKGSWHGVALWVAVNTLVLCCFAAAAAANAVTIHVKLLLPPHSSILQGSLAVQQQKAAAAAAAVPDSMCRVLSSLLILVAQVKIISCTAAGTLLRLGRGPQQSFCTQLHHSPAYLLCTDCLFIHVYMMLSLLSLFAQVIGTEDCSRGYFAWAIRRRSLTHTVASFTNIYHV